MKFASTLEDETDRLAALHRYHILDTEAEPEFDDITRLAAQITQFPTALISLVDTQRQWFKSRVGTDLTESPRDISFCGHTIQGKEIFEVADTLQDERFFDNPLVTGAPHVRSYVGAPLLTAQGHAIGALCIFDSTPRTLSQDQKSALQALARQVMRQMELRLHIEREQKLSRELSKQATFQKVLLDSAVVAVISTDTDGLITSFNPAAERLLGYSAVELLGKESVILFHVEEELQSRARELSAQLGHWIGPEDSLMARPLVGSPETREWSYRRKNGTLLVVRVAMAALNDENGAVTGFVAFAWDITDRKNAREEILRLNGDLERRVNARTAELERTTADLQALSHSIAHDLRQPLISMSGFSHLLGQQVQGDRAKHYVERISLGIKQVNLRADALLYFANLSREPLRRKMLDLGEVARRCIASLQTSSPHRHLVTSIRAPLIACGDPGLLEQVMLELLKNAWESSESQEVSQIEMASRIEETGEEVYFVRDNGTGFDMTYAANLFEPFQSLNASPEHDGHGLGLARAKRIVTKHGGRIWVESKIGQGATIFFTLSPKPQ